MVAQQHRSSSPELGIFGDDDERIVTAVPDDRMSEARNQFFCVSRIASSSPRQLNGRMLVVLVSGHSAAA